MVLLTFYKLNRVKSVYIYAIVNCAKSSQPAMKTSTYFTKEDVALHCTTEDLWVSKFGKVYDYTNLVRVSPSN